VEVATKTPAVVVAGIFGEIAEHKRAASRVLYRD